VDFTLYRKQGEIALWQLVRNFSAMVLRPVAQFRAGRRVEIFLREIRQHGAVLSARIRAACDLPLLPVLRRPVVCQLFSFLEEKRIAHLLNRAFNIGLAILLFLAIRWAASIIVAEISHAQV